MPKDKEAHIKNSFSEIRIEIPDAVLVIVPILPEEAYSGIAADEDIESAGRFGNPRRRASLLAWRTAARKEVGGCMIDYNETGAPVITDKPLYVGVSHSANAAGLIISSKKCAIDIEDKGRNYSAAAPRFISAAEASLPCSEHPDFQSIIWCAKETLYKISGRRKLNLLDDLSITSVDFDLLTVAGEIRGTDGKRKKYDMQIIYRCNIIGVFALETV